MSRLVLTASLLLVSCSDIDATVQPPQGGWQRMMEQPRYDAYERSSFFDDQAVMRVPPEGTVPWSGRRGAPEVPAEIDRALLEEGRARYETFCGPCHGLTGTGETVVAENMELRPPPSLHLPRLRDYGRADLVRIIEGGYGLMPSYASQLDLRERHAVAVYVKVLQLSQHADVETLPPGLRERLAEEADR